MNYAVFDLVHVLIHGEIIECKIIGFSHGVYFSGEIGDYKSYSYVLCLPTNHEEHLEHVDGTCITFSLFGDKESYNGLLYGRDVFDDPMSAYLALKDEELRHPEFSLYRR